MDSGSNLQQWCDARLLGVKTGKQEVGPKSVQNTCIFEFIKKYAVLSNNIYICKSCKFQLNLSNDITESFQAGTANILAINLTTERPLEELREYEKYNKSIKNIDKMVEKIASFYNFDNYIGANINSKKNRNEITKEVIIQMCFFKVVHFHLEI